MSSQRSLTYLLIGIAERNVRNKEPIDVQLSYSWKGILARNQARVLIEQDLVLSIYLSRHNILSTYDGDYICWHVMFGHRIESLWMGRTRCSYFTTVGTIASITNKIDTKFSFRCFNCCIGRRSWYGKPFSIRFEMVNWGRVDRWSCSYLAGYRKNRKSLLAH